MRSIDNIISDIIKTEGGYSDNPNDAGGKTMYGITERVARQWGYKGDMKDLPYRVAKEIYYHKYVVEPGFDKVLLVSPPVCFELVDTGVNCGPGTAIKFFQKALNGLNNQGKLWEDIPLDGGIGPRTIKAFVSFLKHRGSQDGERVMIVVLNCLQAAHYIGLTDRNETQEEFLFGWLKNRVSDQLR